MTQQVVEGIWWIPGRDDFLPDSHMYVIGKPESDDMTLVDCGLMGKGDYKLNEIDELGVSPKSVKRIIMTHSHLDHIGCLPEIKEALQTRKSGCIQPRPPIWSGGTSRSYTATRCLKACCGLNRASSRDCSDED